MEYWDAGGVMNAIEFEIELDEHDGIRCEGSEKVKNLIIMV